MSQMNAPTDLFTDATFGSYDATCFFSPPYDGEGFIPNLNGAFRDFFQLRKELPVAEHVLLPDGRRLVVVAERVPTSFERAALIAHLERGQDTIPHGGCRIIPIWRAANLARPLAAGYMRVQTLEFDRGSRSDFHPAYLLRAQKAVRVAHPGHEPRLTLFGRCQIQHGYMAYRELGTRDFYAMNALHASTRQYIHPVVGIDGLFDIPDHVSPHYPLR